MRNSTKTSGSSMLPKMHYFFYIKIRSIVCALLIVFFLTVEARTQTHYISFSLDPTHINTDAAQGVVNAAGFKFGYAYRFSQGSYILAELGSTSLFGRDTSGERLLTEAVNREALKYRILRTNGFLKLAQVKKSSFFVNIALALRHANEITHWFGTADLTEENTSEILVTTIYDVHWDVGTSFGLSYQYKLTPSLDINIFSEADIYGEHTSSITSGVRILFNVSSR